MSAGPHRYRSAGETIGCLAAILLYFFPFPVAAIVRLFDLKGLFADFMYIALPFLVLLPLIGGVIGHSLDRRHRREIQTDDP